MVAHRVAFVHHPFDKVGAGFEIVAYQEEARLGIMGLQRVQNGRGVPVFKARIESQIEFLFRAGLPARRRRTDKIRVVLLQKLRSGVADRGFAVFLEAQAPIGVGGGGGRRLGESGFDEKWNRDQDRHAQSGDGQNPFFQYDNHTGYSFCRLFAARLPVPAARDDLVSFYGTEGRFMSVSVVRIFLFLSDSGLSRRFEKRRDNPNLLNFVTYLTATF